MALFYYARSFAFLYNLAQHFKAVVGKKLVDASNECLDDKNQHASFCGAFRNAGLVLMQFIPLICRYVEVFFKRTQVAGVNCVDLNTRLVELSRTLPEILQTVFRPYAPFTYNMSVAVWGGCDFSMCDLETGASARQYIPHSIDTAEESAQHLHHLQGSALSITLKPAFVKTLHSALMSPGSPISVYDHLGCGELGQNIRVRALRRSQLSQQQIQQLMRMNCEKLATGLSVSRAYSLLHKLLFHVVCHTFFLSIHYQSGPIGR